MSKKLQYKVNYLGKAVPKSIKSRVEILLEEFPEKFGTDFDKNKQALNELDFSLSRFDRNMIAGFITRTKNGQKE